MLIGLSCLAVFLLMAALMYSRRLSALLALPIMAVLMAAIAAVPAADILAKVLSAGALKLHAAYTTTMFGAVLAELMNKHGLAKTIVRWVAEFAGDNPFTLGLVLTLVTAGLFSTLGGLGAVIMVGTIILPVMLSLGIASITAGALYLFGISLGGMFNIAGWQLYMGVLGVKQEQIVSFVVPFASIIGLIIITFLMIELRSRKNIKYFLAGILVLAGTFYMLVSNLTATPGGQPPPETDPTSVMVVSYLVIAAAVYAIYRHFKKGESNPPVALFTPTVPLILVLFFHWEFIPAFIAGITLGVLTTWRDNSINLLTRSILDGITSVIPAVVLMMGIGMLITAVQHENVAQAISPILTHVIPTKALPYILIFTLIAPLALYRGPLSLWGMGSGLVALIQKVTALSGQAIMSMLMSVGQIQGICDPTNTHNIWIATYLGTDTQVLLKKTIPYAWLATIAGLSLAVYFGFVAW